MSSRESSIFHLGDSAGELLAWGKDVLEPGAAKALAGEGEFKAGDHCRFCKARFTCRARQRNI